ncbi:MAG: lysophospholipid acyltransferase family protein [Brachymonas sp.]
MHFSFLAFLRRLAARMVGYGIIAAAKLLTGVRSLWQTPAESAPTVYFANHNSHADFALVWATLPRPVRRITRPVAGADYWLAKPLRRFVGVEVINALMIAREGGRLRENNPVRQMAAALEEGSSLIMFPEGTRNMGDKPLQEIKSGIVHLAKAYPQARFVPVWIDNVQRVLPKGILVPIPLACTVRYGAPLEFSADVNKKVFLDMVRDALLNLRPAHDRQGEPNPAAPQADAPMPAAPASAAPEASHAD